MPKTDGDEDSPSLKTIPAKIGPKKPKKLFKYRFLTETNLHTVQRAHIFFYIVSLHKKIKSLLKKCKRYREKIGKLEQASRKSSISPEKKLTPSEAKNAPANDSAETTNSFIADIKNAAQQAQNDTGFIYEPTSGLYYDQRTGYYYNAEHGLYYDGNNGCYYSYNQAENKFEFHSQVYSSNETAKEEKTTDNERESTKRKRLKSIDSDKRAISAKNKKMARALNIDPKEDGEISDDYDDSDDDSNRSHSPAFQRKQIVYEIDDDSSSTHSGRHSPYNEFSDIAKKYPPSLRVIVQETNIRKLKIGELFLITYKGGTLGREGKHDVIIPDINCSKYHLKFTYDEDQCTYRCIDLGSRNGTFMNGKRMSNAKQESEPIKLVHGAVLQIGQTKLLCHIHDGHSTCGQCEPGLLASEEYETSASAATVSKSANVSEDHKRQLKNLKKRYGLQDEKYTAPKVDAKNDRAEKRRQAVGSSCEHEKTKSASLNASISSENKGFKMLSKLGWSEGQSLGKNNDGLLEPIPLKSNEKTKGLGCESGISASSFQDPKHKHRARILEKTHQRYHASEAAVDIFKDCSDESD